MNAQTANTHAFTRQLLAGDIVVQPYGNQWSYATWGACWYTFFEVRSSQEHTIASNNNFTVAFREGAITVYRKVHQGETAMAHDTTHILYEWESWVEVEIMGKIRRYSNGYRSIILHRLDTLTYYPQIPDTALKTPVWYSGYNERWYLGNGKALQLPHKLLI